MRWPVSAKAMDDVIALLAAERAEGDQRQRDWALRVGEWLVRVEKAEARADESRRAARDSIQELNARYDALLEKYHALKVTGAVSPQAVAPKELDGVTQAIIAMSRGNPALYQHYAMYVTKARAMHIDDETIAKAIFEGEPDDQGVPI